MPTPIYTIRLTPKTQADIATLAKVYGSPNGRAFAREILETVCSGDPERMQAFNRRLMMGVGEQLALKLNAVFDAPATRDARSTRKARKTRKRGRPRDRSA